MKKAKKEWDGLDALVRQILQQGVYGLEGKEGWRRVDHKLVPSLDMEGDSLT